MKDLYTLERRHEKSQVRENLPPCWVEQRPVTSAAYLHYRPNCLVDQQQT